MFKISQNQVPTDKSVKDTFNEEPQVLVEFAEKSAVGATLHPFAIIGLLPQALATVLPPVVLLYEVSFATLLVITKFTQAF